MAEIASSTPNGDGMLSEQSPESSPMDIPLNRAGIDVELVGFDLKKTLKSVKKNVSLKNALKAARVVGPAVAVIYPPAAPAIGLALKLSDAASKKDPAAIAKIAAIKASAASGDPTAEDAVAALEAASEIRKFNRAKELVERAQKGSPTAQAQIQTIRAAAPTDPEAGRAKLAIDAVLRADSAWPSYFRARFGG